MATVQGLTEQEVTARRQAGEGNNVELGSSRTYWDIARTNLFNVFNNILFVIGAALIALGRVNDALTSVGLGLINAFISTIQEIRAKRQLEKIALLATPKVTVVREGREKTITPNELVKGDIIRVNAGDQIVVDGAVIGDGLLEVDESLLTGEPNLIRKQEGDTLLSGSFCVTGAGYFEAQKVGAASFANQLTATARQFELVQTPLQRNIDFLVRIVMLVVAVMSIIILVTGLLEGLSTLRLVQIAAVLSGQVPYGLFFMIVVAYAFGASTMAKQGALVQQVNAIESLSNIDVLCMDKTGTLTANRLLLHDIYPLGAETAEIVKTQLGDFVHSATVHNQTSEAIMAAIPGNQYPLADEVLFASARKWSALAFDQPNKQGVYVLGAMEMLTPYLSLDVVDSQADLLRQNKILSDQGLRLLLFAYHPTATSLHDGQGNPQLPPLTPLAVVSLKDELRPQAQETISAFKQLGLQLKVISGDNPRTVAALAKQTGFPEDIKLVSGPELGQMNEGEFGQAADEAMIFGRIQPEQKEQLVNALMRQGKRVAMMGDGVNDVLALKKASLGIAMESGSNAARNVADMILLNDSFAALRPAFYEGQRIIGGMSNALYLFLTRVTISTLIIIAVTMIGLDFPFDPSQLVLTASAVGIPSFFLTLWARPQRLDENLLSSLARFVLPVAIVTMLFGAAIYVIDYNTLLTSPLTTADVPNRIQDILESYTGVPFGSEGYSNTIATVLAQGSLSLFLSWTSCLLVLFLEPPASFFLGWKTEVSPDKRPAILAVGLFLLFFSITLFPSIGYYFGILVKPFHINIILIGVAFLWFLVMRTIWRVNLFERFLGMGQGL